MEQERVLTALSFISAHDEVDNIRTFKFDTDSLAWLAGQSQAYVLPEAGPTEKENQRWFTIASAPVEKMIHISTRISESSFKHSLLALKPGDQILTHSLGGNFVWEESEGGSVTLVAGGIGVTPFRSILLQRHATGKPLNATLLFFNRTDAIPFRTELQEISRLHPEFQVEFVIGEPISAEKVLSLAPQASEEVVYLSGPAPVVAKIGSELKERGITVKQDRFPGYDEKNF